MKNKIILFAVFSALSVFSSDLRTGGTFENSAMSFLEQRDHITIINLKQTEKKSSYSKIDYLYQSPIDLTGLKKITVKIKSTQRIKVQLSFFDERGLIAPAPGWPKKDVARNLAVFEFPAEQFKTPSNFDWGKIAKIRIGLGRWLYDSTTQDAAVEVHSIEATTATSPFFVIKKPTTSVAVDGLYRNDWGYEDVLYFWTPPDYIHLEGKYVSGDFSFMTDYQYLYFLGIVSDPSPEKPSETAPWSHDGIELFLTRENSETALKHNRPLSKNGIQLVFDAANKKAVCVTPGKKGEIKCVFRPHQTERKGKVVDGYIVEAAIPLSFFSMPCKRGNLLAYSLKLNDSSSKESIIFPRHLKEPHKNTKGFAAAYFETKTESESRLNPGNEAKDQKWPECYHGKGTFWTTPGHYEKPSQTTERFFLNGFWAVRGTKSEYDIPAGPWFYKPLPMGFGWKNPYYVEKNGKLVSCSSHKEIEKAENDFYWFERQIRIPADWKGKSIRFVLTSCNGEVRLLVNGKSAGSFTMTRTSQEISSLLKYGENNRIDLQLYCQYKPWDDLQNGVGINGDLYFEVSKASPVLADVWMKNADGVTGNFTAEIQLKSSQGKVKCQIIQDGKVLWQGEKKAAAKIEFSGTAQGFKPWRLREGKCATLNVKAFDKNNDLREEQNLTFGFRTFKTENARFVLNGKKIRFRGKLCRYYHAFPGFLQELKNEGFNVFYTHASGRHWNMEPLLSRLDREGIAIFASVDAALPEQETIDIIRQLRKHPSVLGYVSDAYGEFGTNGLGLSPFQTDDKYLPAHEDARNIQRKLRNRTGLFRKADPTRFYFAQATGNMPGVMRNTHHYPTPGLGIMDRLLFHQPWSNRAEKILPHYVYEAGTHYLCYMDLRHPDYTIPQGEKRRQCPRETQFELAARYLGDTAFDGWEAVQEFLFKTGLRGYRINGLDGFTPWHLPGTGEVLNCKSYRGVPDNRKLSYKFFLMPNSEILDWQWMRVSRWLWKLRGIVDRPLPEPFGLGNVKFRPTKYVKYYQNEMQDLFICISGIPGEQFSQDHNYQAGEMVHRLLTVVNDTETDVGLDGKISLKCNNRIIWQQPMRGNVPQGEIKNFSFSFSVPAVTERTPAELIFEGNGRTDSFALTFFPERSGKVAVPKDLRIGIVEGKNGSLAKKWGIAGSPVNLTKPVKGIDLLIIEANALSRDLDPSHLCKFIENGGNALIFRQDDTTLFRHSAIERRDEFVFIADHSNPILKGLTNQDLSMWRGRALSVRDQVFPSKAYKVGIGPALSLPHLTNRGIVCGRPLEIPDFGSIRPILVCGWNNRYTPLMETRSGAGRILFCQLDLDGNQNDPAARLLTANLFEESFRKTSEQIPGVRFSGNQAAADMLKTLGIEISSGSRIGVLGPGGSVDDLKGCTEIVRFPGAPLPPGVTMKKEDLSVSDTPYFMTDEQYRFLKSLRPGADKPYFAGESFRGLTACSTHLFENPFSEKYHIQNGKISPRGRFAETTGNNVRFILCGFSPDMVKSGECKGMVWSIWSTIFHNLGIRNSFRCAFTIPENDFSYRKWTFLAEKGNSGFLQKKYGNSVPRQIQLGKLWEDQGYEDYDGTGWYFLEFPLKNKQDMMYFHVNGVRDIFTFVRTEQKCTLYINGKEQAPPIGTWNGYTGGGGGARLWQLNPSDLKIGNNLLVLKVFNPAGPGGIEKLPVRLEHPGRNKGILFDYWFRDSKYTDYYFWCW